MDKMDKKNLRLYWGENFCPKQKLVKQVLKKAGDQALAKIHQYPGEIQTETIKALAKYHRLKENQMILGNGIENLIHLIARSYIKKETTIISLSPSFPVYETAAINYGGIYREIPIKINQTFTAAEITKKITKTEIFFLAYPNNPTGQYILSVNKLGKILDEYRGLLVIDECYFGIGDQTAINLVNKYENLIVLRSFSKNLGLAGLRFGYAVSCEKIINQLKKYSTEIEADSLNIFSCYIAQAIVPYIKLLTKGFNKFKEEFIKKLKKIKEIKIIATHTSFILIKLTENKDCKKIIRKLAKNYKIFLKDTSNHENFAQNILVFAVPEKKHWNYFLKSLKEIINEF